MMADIEDIKRKIADTEADIADAKKADDKDAIKVLRALLIEQQKEKNILLANQGKFQLLSLHFALSNPLLSTL